MSLAERLRLLERLEEGLGDNYAFRRVSADFRLQAFAWEVSVIVPTYDDAHVLRIELEERREVRVAVLGWEGSMRHTYGRNTLCMWCPKDPPERQWNRADGLLKLVDTARVHLFKELYFRETGEWLGEEVHRDVPKGEARAGLELAAGRGRAQCRQPAARKAGCARHREASRPDPASDREEAPRGQPTRAAVREAGRVRQGTTTSHRGARVRSRVGIDVEGAVR